MDLKIFWLLGLVGIGVGMYLLGHSIRIKDTRDTAMMRAVVGWGIFLEICWVFLGALKFLLTG